MTAQEMFEKLGFKQESRLKWIVWYKDEYDCTIEITFYLESKTFFTELNGKLLEINMPLLKAVNQQCKELGWLDE